VLEARALLFLIAPPNRMMGMVAKSERPMRVLHMRK
jgi:hypothetical protein